MDRRQFIARSGAIIATFVSGNEVLAAEPLDPSDPKAMALGFNTQHTRVNGKQWRKKGADAQNQQRCATCALFTAQAQGRGGCQIFGGKTVPAGGWCNAWTNR